MCHYRESSRRCAVYWMTIIILCTGFGVERTSVVRHSEGSYNQAKQLLLKNECQVVSTSIGQSYYEAGVQPIHSLVGRPLQDRLLTPCRSWLKNLLPDGSLLCDLRFRSFHRFSSIASTCLLLRLARSRLHQSIPSEDLKSHLIEDVGCQGGHRIQRAHQCLANPCLDLYPDCRGHQRSGVTSIPNALRLAPGVNVARWMVLGTGGEHLAD